MKNDQCLSVVQNWKNSKFGVDKIIHPISDQLRNNSISAWFDYYFQVHVRGAPEKTEQAKIQDLSKFLNFFQMEVGHDHVDNWTPAVTKQFQKSLQKTISPKTGKLYKATSVNRTIATLRHVGRWLHKQRPLLAGDPFTQVKDLQTEASNWNGLTSRQIMRLKSACEMRIEGCRRDNQNPLLETAVFYTLLGTGLRESELVSLNVYQYQNKGLIDVMRHKSKRVTAKVPLPQEVRQVLDKYLKTRECTPDEPLFINKVGERLNTRNVYRLCQRILQLALAYLPDEEKFEFTPHKLRHTFLKKVTDKHGIHFAQEMSGNVSIKEIFRYAKPGQEEMQQTIEELFV